jgi:CheY-like chemotaxis protein
LNAPGRRDSPSRCNGSVLVVEDDPDLRGALAAILEGAGYGVVEAEHGREALRHLRSGLTICLIVLDLFMPEMNGWAFRAEQTKDARLAAIPVVIISADSKSAERARALGVVTALTKPIDIDRLLQVLGQHC